ncbi:hypothetical protein [Candidatus Venteria ishoeyi]|uniref:Sulfotransferase family protein n=1 Tax=Candidatus Venteria ishoeyi TaxID=1899563 RepID=A0A1H6F902_9GAMM|nr:hypothetical protein [Candidatus Venteria ishoeyi]SEH04183.1 Uncharacterised protein [Candidatus Venteria ishoeyi]SEH05576.1 Uncharacterised protein [Candidatus Venteria ishoeyi]SEH05851.1 Uncharacterised protein [Candidatus Venteria ishoeyi]
MNIFILNTGRCGSTTFIKACQHIDNYTAAHESRLRYIGRQRLAYPEQHIEADNRLSWLLGRLEQAYGDQAFYVHLRRNPAQTADSFAKRSQFGVMRAYKEGFLLGGEKNQSARDIALDYIDSIDSNIALFLKDKSRQMDFHLESAQADFTRFWHEIGASGDLQQALMEWDVTYNASR